MTGQDLPAATYRRSRWPGWIWSVPIAAIGIAVWLAIRAIATSGPTVQVDFPQVADIKAGNTKVKFQRLSVGSVQRVTLDPNLHGMRVTLRLDPSMKGHLGRGTRFWIEGASPSLGNLSSLRAIIGGPSIGVDPASGPGQDHFQGTLRQPLPGFGAHGRTFVLETGKLGSLQRGSPITYRGQKIGVVQSDHRIGADQFRLTAFIDAADTGLVHDGSRFWSAGPVSLQTGGTGPRLDFHSLPALIEGAVSLETPPGPAAGPVSAAGHQFHLYGSREAAIFAPSREAVFFRLDFPNPGSAIAPHAAVTLGGTRIGSVVRSRLAFDAATGRLSRDVKISIEPSRVDFQHAAGTPQAAVRAMMAALVKDGLEASLTATPPVVGGETIALRIVPGRSGTLGGGAVPQIPTAGGGDIGALLAQAHQIEQQIAAIPFARIGRSAAKAAQGAAHVLGSPAIGRTLQNAEETSAHARAISRRLQESLSPMLADLRRSLRSAEHALNAAQAMLGGGMSGPGTEGLPRALYEITRAARSLRALTTFLDEHPQSLLTGYHGRN